MFWYRSDVRKRKQIWAFHQLFSELFDFLQNENLVPWFFYWLLYLLLDGNIFPHFSILYSFISSMSIYLAKLNFKISHNNNPFRFEFPWTVFWILRPLTKREFSVEWVSTQCLGPLCLWQCFLSISPNRIPRLGTAITHLNLNVHELFSKLFEYLQKENLVPWFFYWLYIFSKDGNIFPYLTTLYSFISS